MGDRSPFSRRGTTHWAAPLVIVLVVVVFALGCIGYFRGSR